MSTTYPQYNLTNFPDAIDTFIQAADIMQDDIVKIQAYQAALLAGDTTLAASKLASIDNGVNKLNSASKWNKIRDAVLALEAFYTDPTKNFQTYINSVISPLAYQGVYSGGTVYKKNNIVSSTDGILYIYVNNNSISGQPLTNTIYWRQFSIPSAGEQLTYMGTWSNATSYMVSNLVTTSDGSLFKAKANNTNQQPYNGSSYWEVVINAVSTRQYPLTATQPTDQVNGDIWMEIINPGVETNIPSPSGGNPITST